MTRRLIFTLIVSLLMAQLAFAADRTWDVTVTNITANQIIGPPVIATHGHKARIFRAGKRATGALAAVAEDADSSGLVAALEGNAEVLSVVTGGGPLLPGDSMTLSVTTTDDFQRLSAVAMLVTTNDAFFGIDSFQLHSSKKDTMTTAPAYDAGSEANDELCASIPGPPCGNPFVRVTDGAEGFVHVHPGITGRGDLDPAARGWLNPVVEIRFVRQ